VKEEYITFEIHIICMTAPSIDISYLTNYKTEQLRQHTVFNCLFICVKEHRCIRSVFLDREMLSLLEVKSKVCCYFFIRNLCSFLVRC
jgi:hypothetical protein